MNTLLLVLACLSLAGLAFVLILAALLYLMMIQHRDSTQ